jgi:hypothetical protein
MDQEKRMDPEKIQDMRSLIEDAYDILRPKQLFSNSREKEENKLTNTMKLFITRFYILNPDENHLNNFFNKNLNMNYIIKSIRRSFTNLRFHHEKRAEIVNKIMEYAIICVNDFIRIIEQAPEKIPINEKKIAGIRTECTNVLGLDDEAKLHEELENVDNVVFLQPAEYMRPNTVKPVKYKYLAFTYPKKFIKTWLKDPKRIQYCDADELNFEQDAIPYILCPLSFNCNPAYVKFSQILHIIHSNQRIFYILVSPSEGPHNNCMKKDPESQEIIHIAICDSNKEGNKCWKFDENTQCIEDSETDKIKIQTECNMEEYEEYIQRKKMFSTLRNNEDEEILKSPNSVESVSKRERNYMKI